MQIYFLQVARIKSMFLYNRHGEDIRWIRKYIAI